MLPHLRQKIERFVSGFPWRLYREAGICTRQSLGPDATLEYMSSDREDTPKSENHQPT